MMIENCPTLRLLPKFCRILGHKPIGKKFLDLRDGKFHSKTDNGVGKYSTNVSAHPEEQNTNVSGNSENKNENEKKQISTQQLDSFRYKFPEFLPDPKVDIRNAIREKLERRDMLRRRSVINIPEFYVGSVLAVTSSDKHATGKLTRFVGICIYRKDWGLQTKFILRNVIQHLGVEIQFSLYSPLIQKIEVLRLEKRLDDELFYLRDAPNEYSTFPFDMVREYNSENLGVPVNTIKVPLNPRPWLQRYERMNLKGAIVPEVTEKMKRQAIERAEPWKKYDLMEEYRATVPEEEQKDVFAEICDELEKLEVKGKLERRKKVFVKPTKQKVF